MLGSKWIVFVGACLAAIGVGLGAIGAHALPDYLANQQKEADIVEAGKSTDIQKKLDTFEKGVRYQLYHAMAIIVIGLSALSGYYRGLRIAACWMILGILLFSGGIYGIVFTPYPTHWVVPFGGVSFIIGWLWLAIATLMIFEADTVTR